MKILVTNDDGIFAPGLRVLANELKKVAQVVAVAPDREQSALGTAVTLRQPLRVQRLRPVVPKVVSYAVEGTPADSVILALGKLVSGRVDLVVSGINPGPNLGDNVLISGTVGAALQGYQHGVPSLAVSIDGPDERNLRNAAKLAALLAEKIDSGSLKGDIFLNVNLPDRPLPEIGGIEITELADRAYNDTISEDDDGRRKYYWLLRDKIKTNANSRADIGAVERGNISVTPLHTDLFRKPLLIPDNLCAELFRELSNGAGAKD
ncbi:5'/3'-nucleotidase SurE [Chloroflexota bacterium]